MRAPYIAILSFNRGTRPEQMGSRSGEDITIDSLIEMIDLSSHMGGQSVQPDFPIPGESFPSVDPTPAPTAPVASPEEAKLQREQSDTKWKQRKEYEAA